MGSVLFQFQNSLSERKKKIRWANLGKIFVISSLIKKNIIMYIYPLVRIMNYYGELFIYRYSTGIYMLGTSFFKDFTPLPLLQKKKKKNTVKLNK